MLLMCKNNPVFNIENEFVLNNGLLPGIMQNSSTKRTFISWMGKRYSEKSNTFARKLRGLVFGRATVIKLTRQHMHFLSLIVIG